MHDLAADLPRSTRRIFKALDGSARATSLRPSAVTLERAPFRADEQKGSSTGDQNDQDRVPNSENDGAMDFLLSKAELNI